MTTVTDARYIRDVELHRKEPVSNGVTTYRAIRYAAADRFEPSRPVAFGRIGEPGRRGPIPPQNPSRLEMVLGPQAPLEQAEDCLVLSVSTPGLTGRRPVLVWFHGGANVSGGGELPWYDASGLAAEQDIVVVVVTARLGLLGFLHLDGQEGPTLATGDQLNALDWVMGNIDRFGGDPANVTLGGQSAGATAIEAMLRWGLPDGVRGVILQSGYKMEQMTSAAEASSRTEHVLELSGRHPIDLTISEVLDLQRRFTQVSPAIWTPVKPVDGRPFDVPVIAGWTRDDGLPFAMLAAGLSDPATADTPLLVESASTFTYDWFIRGAGSVVSEARAAGCGGWLYEFGHESRSSGWGSPHCMELPYLLGDERAWAGAPMLQGADWSVLRGVRSTMRREWAHFMRHQEPGGPWAPIAVPSGPVDRRYGAS